MGILNHGLAVLFDLLLYPFQGWPLLGLTLVSLVTAVFMLVVFGATSDQRRLEEVKRQIHACIFEVRLFNDDLRAILRAQNDILKLNLRYIGLSLVPMIWILVPLVFLVAQLQFQYGYAGLRPGETTVVEAQLKPVQEGGPELTDLSDRAVDAAVTDRRLRDASRAGVKPTLRLEAPDGLTVETPPVWIPSQRRTAWRVRADRRGVFELRVQVGDEATTKRLRVADGVVRRSPVRVSPSLLEQLIYPAERPLSSNSILSRITVQYRDYDIDVLGWKIDWLIVFFVLSIVFAFVLRKPLDVTI